MHTNWFGEASFGLEKQEFGENEIFEFGQWRLTISRLLFWVRESSGKWAKDRPQCLFLKSCRSEGNWLTTPTAPSLSLFCWNLFYYFHIFNLHFLIFYFPATFQNISSLGVLITTHFLSSAINLSPLLFLKKKKPLSSLLSLFLNKEFS